MASYNPRAALSSLSPNPKLNYAQVLARNSTPRPGFNYAGALGSMGYTGASSVPDGLPTPTADPSQDWGAFLANDPGLNAYKAELAAESTADKATLAAQRERAVVQFGEAPTIDNLSRGLLGEGYGTDINDQTQQLAAKNTAAGLSTVSRLGQHDQDMVRQIQNQLAARGALRSGETGFQLGREQLSFRQGRYDATQKLIDYLAGVNASFVAAERARKLALANYLASIPPPPGDGSGGGAPPTAAPPGAPAASRPAAPSQSRPATSPMLGNTVIGTGYTRGAPYTGSLASANPLKIHL